MTRKDSKRTISEIKAIMGEDGDFLRPMVRTVIQEFLEAEMAEAVGAEKGERAEGRLSASKRLLPAQLDYAGRKA
jgi:putative transposase